MEEYEQEAFRKVSLQKKRFYAQIEQEVRDASDYKVIKDEANYIYDSLVHRLTKEILAFSEERNTVRVDIEVPSSWWQHFKQDHMPQWFTGRYPVKFNKVEADIVTTDILPLAEVPRDLGPVIRYAFPTNVRIVNEG